jgi:chemotaxis protein MotA
MGLIQVMKHLEDIKEVGHGIAVAFVATVYGVGLANIFFLPVANKLKARMRASSLRKDMVLEGVIGIVEGLNPTLIRMKLEAYQEAPAPRKAKPAASVAAAAGAPSGRGMPAPAAAKP